MKIFITHPNGDREELTNLYGFEEIGIRTFDEGAKEGFKFEFEVEPGDIILNSIPKKAPVE